jgi:hypothetical protein
MFGRHGKFCVAGDLRNRSQTPVQQSGTFRKLLYWCARNAREGVKALAEGALPRPLNKTD